MVAPSKLFQEPICSLHCSQAVIHPGQSCIAFFLRNLPAFSTSCLKYFLPLLISPLLTKFGSLNRQMLQQTLTFYAQVVSSSTLAASFIFVWICAIRNLRGKYGKYSTFFIPSVIGCSILWLWPQRVLNLYAVATSQATIEAFLRHRSNACTRLIYKSRLVQTLLFMLNSSILMHFKRSSLYKGFWFVQPIARRREPEKEEKDAEEEADIGIGDSTKCTHEGETCLRHVLGSMKRYAALGLTVDLVGILRRGRGVNDVRQFKMTGFFLGYNFIYRLSNCALKRLRKTSCDRWSHALSAFLGGAAYAWLDELSIYTFSLALTVQLLWGRFCDRRTPSPQKEPHVLLLEQLKRVPFAKIIVPVNIAILMNCFFMYPHLVSRIGRNIFNNISNNTTKEIHESLNATSVENILKDAAVIPRSGFFRSA